MAIGPENLSVQLIASTFALYGANILLVSTMNCLAGTAVSGVMALASRSGNWMGSLIVVAVMAMVYVSYRAQVRQAVAGPAMGCTLN